MQSGHPTLVQQFPMYPHCTFALQKTYHIRHTLLRRDAQAQVDMIAHHMSFQQPDPLLFAQIP